MNIPGFSHLSSGRGRAEAAEQKYDWGSGEGGGGRGSVRGYKAPVCEGHELGGGAKAPLAPPGSNTLEVGLEYVDSHVPSSATLTAWLARV